MSAISEKHLETSSGKIAFLDTQGPNLPVILIHGNSACKEVFCHQFEKLRHDFRVIAFDLPGHGNSDKALDPSRVYSLEGYAKVTLEVLTALKIKQAILVGWSLGGHIALEVASQSKIPLGVAITGTPPIPLTEEGFKAGFHPFDCLHLLSQEKFTEEEAKLFISQGGIDPSDAPFLISATLKADGLARKHLIQSMQKGVGCDEKELVETSDTSLAIIGGKDDKGINNDYIASLNYKNLWEKIHLLEGGHAIFWENHSEFNDILKRFIDHASSEATLSISL